MENVYGFLALAALVYLAWNLVTVLFAKGRRKSKLAKAGLAFVAIIGFGIGLAGVADENAQVAGFLDAADKRRAEGAGITDPTLWAASREEQLANEKQAAATEQEVRQAEERAETQAKAEQAALAAKQEKELQEAEEAKKAATELAAQQECMKDIQCWGEKAWIRGGSNCARLVERMAKHDYEWTDGLLEPKFSHYRWRDPGAGTVTIIGDKIKMQNGFGAWTHMTYECDYNPTTDIVSDIRVFEGRL